MNAASRRSRLTWKSFICHLAAGAMAGSLVVAAFALSDDPADSVTDVPITPIPIGLIIGFLVWIVVNSNERSASLNAKKTARRASKSDAQESERSPTPFVKRLAQYMSCDEAELNKPRPKPKSKMKFWSMVEFGKWHGPRPVVVIRRILRRIQESVHGTQHRR